MSFATALLMAGLQGALLRLFAHQAWPSPDNHIVPMRVLMLQQLLLLLLQVMMMVDFTLRLMKMVERLLVVMRRFCLIARGHQHEEVNNDETP